MSKLTISFVIDHLENQGKGVYKDEKVYFIPKTLPGEEGEAVLYQENKSIGHGKIIKLTKESSDRITPSCPHYVECGGCHYLHTSYEKEFEFKKNSLSYHFRKLLSPHRFSEIVEHYQAKQRINYRNRIQLHYDLDRNAIGLFSQDQTRIIPVSQCLLPTLAISKKLKDLMVSQGWRKLIPPHQKRGHIELLELKNHEVQTSVNNPYSYGGFQQVNHEMNQALKDWIDKILPESKTIVELFGGSGNLTQNRKNSKIILFDSSEEADIKVASPSQTYIRVDLYQKFAALKVTKKLKKIEFPKTDLLILDPPRSGLKNINEFVDEIKPQFILYISCDPSTLSRDLYSLKDQFTPEKLALFDFFPSTYHYETAVLLKRNE